MSEPEDKTVKTRAAPRTAPGTDDRAAELGFAAALKYDAKRDTAPRVVAKGKGDVAKRIVEIAKASGIPIRKDADLVELLAAIDLDEQIPLEAFTAVAEILAYIYRANRDASSPEKTTGATDDRHTTPEEKP